MCVCVCVCERERERERERCFSTHSKILITIISKHNWTKVLNLTYSKLCNDNTTKNEVFYHFTSVLTEHNRYPTEHNRYPTEHTRYPTEHNRYPTEHTRYPTEHTRYPTEHNRYPTEQFSYKNLWSITLQHILILNTQTWTRNYN